MPTSPVCHGHPDDPHAIGRCAVLEAGDRVAPNGPRFAVTYRVVADDRDQARARADDICFEQTIELPADLEPGCPLCRGILGRIEEQGADGPGAWRFIISYDAATAGGELTQLLNVAFGNTSLKPGIRIVGLDLPAAMHAGLGPGQGMAGWRTATGVSGRPLICSALKPMGMPAPCLAEVARRMARGGADLIKDDHGLADQPFCSFAERVPRVLAAVAEANRETGGNCVYLPNITAPHERLRARARRACELGARALLVAPGLTGFDGLRALARDDQVDVPLMAHPALLGGWVSDSASGIDHATLFGRLLRLAGADATVFPNWGGRFGFSREECLGIAAACREPIGGMAPIAPAPGGGMTPERAAELLAAFGQDAVWLVGGGLQRGDDLAANCRALRRVVEAACS